jgi:CheY-like chemotaxis protein
VNLEKANVLLVDEHPDDLEAALDDLGLHLVKAHSGKEALRLLEGQDFAVVLLGVQMSGLDGFETVRQLLALGAVDFLVKPLRPVVLRAKVAVFVELEQARQMELQEYERKRAEENARFRALTEHSSDAVTLVGADGTILYSSPSSRRVLGYEPDEFIGRSGFEVVHPDDQGRVAVLLADLVRQPGASPLGNARCS